MKRILFAVLCGTLLWGCAAKEKTTVEAYYADLTDTIYYLGNAEDFTALYEHGTGVIVVFDETNEDTALKEIETMAKEAGLTKVMLAQKDTVDISLQEYPSVLTVIQGEASVSVLEDTELVERLEEVKAAQSENSDTGCDTECVFDPSEN